MGVAEILGIVNMILGIAFQLYSSISKIQGDTPIPTWDELTSQNKLLQDKIDAEK